MKFRAGSLFFALASAALTATATDPISALQAQMAALQAQVVALRAQVNTDAGYITTLQTNVAKLEGQITTADLVGTYALHGIQNEMDTPSLDAVPAQISSYVYVGTVVLNADGTASFLNLAQSGNNILLAPPNPVTTADSAPSSGSGTWSYANGVVTLAETGGGTPPPLSVAAGGRLLVGAGAGHSDGTDVLLIATRLQ